MDDLLGGPIPREDLATCHDCVMQPKPGEEAESRLYFFRPEVKCCTYVPELHNFLVGEVLADADPLAAEGRATVEKRVADGVGVTPLGLMQPPVFALLYDNSTESFGRSRSLRCPHYLENGGRCGVWRYRDSTCVTWFCKHRRGGLGYAFWRQGLHRLLQTVERDLSMWCVLELCANDDTLKRVVATGGWTGAADDVTGDAIDNRANPSLLAEAWGEWRGRERQFYMRCAELVTPLSWHDVLAMCGPDVRAYARLTKHAFSRMCDDAIPPSLTVGPFQLVQIRRGTARVNSYSDYDPLDVPVALMEVLPYFDGRRTDEALALIEKERGVRIDPTLVRKMVDFTLLVPPK
jgi:hypothetical protein